MPIPTAPGTITKKCEHCQTIRPAKGFRKGFCGSCRTKRWRHRNPRKYRNQVQVMRERYYDPNATIVEIQQQYVEQDDLKIKAQNFLNTAIRDGNHPPVGDFTCVFVETDSPCGKPARKYHHYKGYDEDNWLDVEPYCRRHYREINKSSTSMKTPSTDELEEFALG